MGALSYLDHETVQIIERTVGPKYGPPVSHGLIILGGLATAYRGFTNSRRRDDDR